MESMKFFRILIIFFGVFFIAIGLFCLLYMPPLSFIASIPSIAAGVGLLKRKKWARYLVIFVAATCYFGLIPETLNLIATFNRSSIDVRIIIQDVLGWIIVSGIIYFFTRPKVSEQFK